MNEVKGILGAIITLIMPFLNFIGIAIQITGASLGLYLVIISIRNKRLESKKLKLENEKLNLEIKNLQNYKQHEKSN